MATDIMGVSGREMIEALIAGQRDPRVLAELARGRMRVKRAALVHALTGQFDDHHAEVARMLLDHIDTLTRQIDHLTGRVDQLIAAIPAAQPPTDTSKDDNTGATGSGHDAPLPAIARLDEVPGIGVKAAQIVVAEIGLDMSQLPTAGHLVSWAKLSPRTIQSGTRHRAGKTGKANPYLKGVLGEVAAADRAVSSIPAATLDYLASLEWITARENLALVGPAGTGKSHLLVALGVAAVQAGHRVRYFTAADLVETSTAAWPTTASAA